MRIPFFDLKRQWRKLGEEIGQALLEVAGSGNYIGGPKVEAIEGAVASYTGVKHAVGVSSGTDALLCTLTALGLRPGDEVVTSVFTFFATAGSIVRAGATPRFVDIEAETFNMNPNLLERAITEKTKAILPVHLYGQCADMNPILDISRRHGLAVVEDVAQALGAIYDGKQAGSFGKAGCLSFFPTKNLGAMGDGGMVVTDDGDLAARIRVLRDHGADQDQLYRTVGGNFRLDALHAAILLIKLPHLEEWIEGRRRNARRYISLFQEAGLSPSPIKLPDEKWDRHTYNQFVIRCEKRDELKRHLLRSGVGCRVYYPYPLSRQPCFKGLGYKPEDFPNAERASREVLALPIYPELTEGEQEEVVEAIKKFYRSG